MQSVVLLLFLTWTTSLRPGDPYICVGQLGHHWMRERLVAWSAPNHYLNQCWHNVNLKIFIQGNSFVMTPAKRWPFCLGLSVFRGGGVVGYMRRPNANETPPYCLGNTVHSILFSHDSHFDVFCCGLQSIGSTHNLQGYFTGTGTNISFHQYQWSNLVEYSWMYHTNWIHNIDKPTTKWSAAKYVHNTWCYDIETLSTLLYWPFVTGINRSRVVSSHKGPVMQRFYAEV